MLFSLVKLTEGECSEEAWFYPDRAAGHADFLRYPSKHPCSLVFVSFLTETNLMPDGK